MDIFTFDMTEFLSFVLTFMRLSVVVFMLPVFGGKSAPTQVKAALCIVLTLAVFPALSIKGAAFPAHPFDLALIFISELLLGLVLSLSVRFVFAGIQTGGQIMGFQMGFSMLNIADPMSGNSISITSQFLYIVALLTFMLLNGHLLMLKGVAATFELIPPGGVVLSQMGLEQVLSLSAEMFLLAVQIAAPVTVALFLVELALAIMGRAAPQMNLLIIGFPLKIAVGFFFLGFLMTFMADKMREFISGMVPMMIHLLEAMAPVTG